MLIMPKSGTYYFLPRKEGMSCPMNSRWLSSTPSGAASAQRGGIKTNTEVFQSLSEALRSNDKLADHPDVCAKIAELMPMSVQSMRVIIASKRIAMDTSEIEEIIDTVRQHVL